MLSCARMLLLWCGLILTAGVARAAEPPILNAAAVPGESGRLAYANFLVANLPRAFAVSPSGAVGWQGGGGTIEQARANALAYCSAKGATDCEIYAEDLQVVWHGKPPVTLARPSGPLKAERDYALVYDERYVWRGPAAARGVYVWGHGKGDGQDGRGVQAQGYVRVFNNAGFDVIRFARAPFPDDAEDAAAFLRAGLAELRARGWKTVVVGGQSRGAWNALQSLDTPGLADAVIADSPANLGGASSGQQAWRFSRILLGIKNRSARVAMVQFTNDSFIHDPDERAAAIREYLPPRVAALLFIDRPAGIDGHGGGNSAAFAQRFGGCLLLFVTDPHPPSSCPGN